MKTQKNNVGVAGGWKDNDGPRLNNSRVETQTLLLPFFPELPISSDNVFDFIVTEGFRELYLQSQTRRFGGVEVLQKPGTRRTIEPARVANAVDVSVLVARKLYSVFMSAVVRPRGCSGEQLIAIVTNQYVRWLIGNPIVKQAEGIRC